MLLISNKISINKNKQIYFFLFFIYFSLLIFYHKKPARFGWKPIPSATRVIRDEVSGFIKMRRTAVWKTVPYKLFRLRLTRHVQNLSRIKRMRRICSFTDFFIWLSLYLDFYAPLRRFDYNGFLYAVDFLRISIRYVSLWLLYAVGNPRRTGANTIRNKSKTK